MLRIHAPAALLTALLLGFISLSAPATVRAAAAAAPSPSSSPAAGRGAPAAKPAAAPDTRMATPAADSSTAKSAQAAKAAAAAKAAIALQAQAQADASYVLPPPLKPLEEHPRTARSVVDQLQTYHFVKRPLDDQVSSRTLDAYLKVLDEEHAYFTAADIKDFDKHRLRLDDALRQGDLTPAYDIFNRYQTRVVERLKNLLAVLYGGLDKIDFASVETLEIDREKSPWAKSSAELDDLWRRRLKATVLPMVLRGKSMTEVQDLLIKRYHNRLLQTGKTVSEDAFQAFINAFASTYDPHTQYFSPRVSENFNITMSLQLEGIGAVLRTEDEYTTVVSLVPAGPADKTGQLKATDRILAVGQGAAGPMTDVVGWRLDDVVEMVRGPKETIVRLEVAPARGDGHSKIVQITRNTVQLEEQSAHKKTVTFNDKGRSRRIGIIEIPTFYADFEAMQRGDADYKSTTRDVHKLIDELKVQGIDGLVIDLRNNGGGSLQEANSLTGLFIDSGPTVQLRGANRRVTLFSDDDGKVTWAGPMAVLVNRMSASASEIFAAAIQDYQRGLVIGSTTFGKGTVQSLEGLARGQLKYTQQKFYRISGQSTQHQGVKPDIRFPELYDPHLVGESALDDSLPWDTIRPAAHRHFTDFAPMLPALTAKHAARSGEDAEFRYVESLAQRATQERDRKTVSLNLATRKKEQVADDAWRLNLENSLRKAKGQPLYASVDQIPDDGDAADGVTGGPPPLSAVTPGESGRDAAKPATALKTPDAAAAAKKKKEEEPDAMAKEAGHILVDLIVLARPAAVESKRTADAH